MGPADAPLYPGQLGQLGSRAVRFRVGSERYQPGTKRYQVGTNRYQPGTKPWCTVPCSGVQCSGVLCEHLTVALCSADELLGIIPEETKTPFDIREVC